MGEQVLSAFEQALMCSARTNLEVVARKTHRMCANGHEARRPTAFTSRRTDMSVNHFGLRPCIINEHKPGWIQINLGLEPVLPLL